MKNKTAYQQSGIILFVIFVFFSLIVAKNVFTQIDFNSTVKIQDYLGNGVIEFFSLFSFLGTVEVASIVLLVLLAITTKTKRIYVLILFALTGVFELLGKFIINQTGPPILFLKTKTILEVPSSYIPHEFFSYPSGHSARTAFVSGFLILIIMLSNKMTKLQKQIVIIAVLIFDFIMFLSRVYLGEHWLSDVIGGALLGFSLALLVTFFLTPAKLSKK